MAGILASSRIVGRAAELAALNDALRLATEGEPSFVLIGGDAGLGKTGSSRSLGRARAARVAHSTCLDTAGRPALRSVPEALRGRGLSGLRRPSC
jgi:hypothetical protein